MYKYLFILLSLFLQGILAPCAGSNKLLLNDAVEERTPAAGTPDTASWMRTLQETVIVLQPKEREPPRRQPISSTVLMGDDATQRWMLSSATASDLSQLSGYVPSFVFPAYGSRLNSAMYIRGIGSRVNAPAVGIYYDGIPLVGKSSYNFHSYQLERVDVLRGPQGTLYGVNTEGGLVRMFSKNPMTATADYKSAATDYKSAATATDVNVSFGTHAMRSVEAAHYHRFNHRLALSAAAFYNGGDGYFENHTIGKRADPYNEAGGKTHIVYKPTDRLNVDFVADYQYVNQGGYAYGLLDTESGHVASPAANRQGRYRRNMFNTGMNIGFKADKFIFHSMTSYQYMKDLMRMDQDYMPEDYMHLNQRQLMNAITQEFSFKSRDLGGLQIRRNSVWRWTSGVFGSYQWLKTSAPVGFDSDFTQRIATPVQAAMYNSIVSAMAGRYTAAGMSAEMARQKAATVVDNAGGVALSVDMSVPALFHTPQFNLGFYHESCFTLADRLKATLGLRYDYNHVSIDYDTRAAMSFVANVMGTSATYVLSSALNSDTRNDFNQLLPRFSLSYDLNDGAGNVYLTVCKGYRAGGYNIQMFSDILQTELNANSDKAMSGSYDITHTATDYQNVNKTIAYKPEESWNYEIGTHLNLFHNMVQADFSAYYMQIKNQQLSVMAGNYGFGRMMVNAGRSRSCGIEASLRGCAFNKHLTWAASYGYTNTVFRQYKDEIDNEEVDYKGKRVPFVPSHTMSACADYTFIFSGNTIKSLTLGADLKAQGDIYWDEANTYSQPFYVVLGAHAGLQVGMVQLKAWCRNLTDTHYNTFAFDSSASGQKLYFAQRGTPLQAGFDIGIHF